MKSIWSKTCRKQGFTLIELLVVVLIIGILAAVALPQYHLAVDRAKYKQAMLVVKEILKAEQVYYLEHGELATDLSQLDLTFGGEYGNASAAGDKITFDWGTCSLTNWSDIPSCSVRNPYMHYSLHNLPNIKEQRCVADVDSSRALAVCKAEFPNVSSYDSATYCVNRTCRIFKAPYP